MEFADWKEYAVSWSFATPPDYGLAAKILRARTWAELEKAIPCQLVAAFANRCRVEDL